MNNAQADESPRPDDNAAPYDSGVISLTSYRLKRGKDKDVGLGPDRQSLHAQLREARNEIEITQLAGGIMGALASAADDTIEDIDDLGNRALSLLDASKCEEARSLLAELVRISGAHLQKAQRVISAASRTPLAWLAPAALSPLLLAELVPIEEYHRVLRILAEYLGPMM